MSEEQRPAREDTQAERRPDSENRDERPNRPARPYSRDGRGSFSHNGGGRAAYRGSDSRRGPARSGLRPQAERRPSQFSREDRPQGERRPGQFGREDRPQGERRPGQFSRDGQRGSYPRRSGGFSRENGENRALRGEKRDFQPGKRPYSGNRPAGGAPRRDARPPYHAAPRITPRPAPTDGMPARRLALEVIRAVTERNAYASLTLDEKLNACTLSALDRRLAARLSYDTIENIDYLDFALRQVMAKPDTDIRLVNILRLAACQLLLEDRIPENAATDTAVKLCKELGMEGLAGVCNGILRNLVREKDNIPWPDEETEPVKALALRRSVPEWLVEQLMADYGLEETKALLAVRGSDAPINIRRNLLQGSDEEFEQLLSGKAWQAEQGFLPHTWRLKGVLNIGHDSDFNAGKFSIQSIGSMLACLAAAPKRGQRVLDACAAPGGKSCLMAEMMDGTGRVQAWELHPHRTALIEAQAHRLRLENVRPMTRDALKPRDDMVETMDVVLLDAPCSGTGDMAEKPDIKLRLKRENLEALKATQAQLLDTVSAYVRPGGTLVYATCSVLKDENERQVAAFLANHPDFEVVPLPDSIPPQLKRAEGPLGLQLLPHREWVGGFYLCRMRRKL